METVEKYIANALTDDVLTSGDSIWEKNVEYAANLINTNAPIEKMRDFELHALIAYAAHYLDGMEVEDAQAAKAYDNMRHVFWFAVWCLAENKMKRISKSLSVSSS